MIRLEELKQENSDAMKVLKEARLKGEKTTGNSSIVIENSLENIYPEYKEYSRVISFKEAISGKIPQKEELERRIIGYFYTADKLFTGVSKKDIELEFNVKFGDELSNFKGEIKGNTAYFGKTIGKVRKIIDRNQLKHFKEGEILVSPSTLPSFLPAMRKSAGIISDEGGVVCHAAIVARELKKPCIIGTKIAVDVLNDGDLIEVDANKGVVKILEKAKV
jgi:pyruvate,water dikinase